MCLLWAAGVFLVCYIAWSLVVGGEPAPLLPPAGQVLEGRAPFRFAILGDNRRNMEVFEDALARIKRDDVRFILHLGDLVHRAEAGEFRWVLHELWEADLKAPFCPVPGNHDIGEGPADVGERYRQYRRAFGPRRYWFSCANAMFVAFDDAAARCRPEDLAWLDRTLREHRGQYALCFVFMHVPPRDPRPGAGHALARGADELIRVLRRHEVSAIFAAHIHDYLEDRMGGIPIFITGGAGARLQPGGRHHYLLCSVEQDGSFRVTKHDVPDELNTDYPEYVFRTQFPDRTFLFAAAGLLMAGMVLMRRHRRKTGRLAG